jgi:hypothetical protein
VRHLAEELQAGVRGHVLVEGLLDAGPESLPQMFMVPPAMRPTPSASSAMSSRNAWATVRSAPSLSLVTRVRSSTSD